jgi:hypothetical protein
MMSIFGPKKSTYKFVAVRNFNPLARILVITIQESDDAVVRGLLVISLMQDPNDSIPFGRVSQVHLIVDQDFGVLSSNIKDLFNSFKHTFQCSTWCEITFIHPVFNGIQTYDLFIVSPLTHQLIEII